MIDILARSSPIFELILCFVKSCFRVFLFCLMAGQFRGLAQVTAVPNKEPLPATPSTFVAEPVPVPETIGATLLAGVGFVVLFRRRRFS
jgi:hypothetical protein